jgi:hypothetical protein
VLRGEHLQLERYGEPVVQATRPEPEEALAGLEHRACGHGLEAVKVGQAIGIGLVGPGEPEALDTVLQLGVVHQARRLDAAADGVRGEARRGIRGIGVGPHQLPGACSLQLAALQDQAVDALAAGAPGDEAPLHLRAVEACAQGELARRQEPRRSGDASNQVQCSETFRGIDPDLPHRSLALQRLQLALDLGDRAGDLGRATVLDSSAVVGYTRNRAVPLRLQRLETRLKLCRRGHTKSF